MASDVWAQSDSSPRERPQALKPIPWQQRTLFIPYQPNKEAPAAPQIGRVQLLLSRTGTDGWVVLQSADPSVRGFNYHAPEDGEYWFALRHLDANGQALDGSHVEPQLRLLINTQTNLAFGSASPSQSMAESTPASAQQAGQAVPTQLPSATSNPFQVAARPPHDWPISNQVPSTGGAGEPDKGVPPTANAYTAANDAGARRTPAKFAVETAGKPTDADNTDPAWNQLEPKSGPPQPAQVDSKANSEWSSAGPQNGPMQVNARTFDVEYDLQAVSPWGVAKVELWGTQDQGATWRSFGADTDNLSPIRVSVPSSGTYGFRIIVEGANSLGVQPPQAGDKPELVVMVDLDVPKAEVTAVEVGSGKMADQLCIRWLVEDKNLEPRSIGLYYSSYAEGPWSTIADGLENTSSYVWKIERHIPGRFFLKLEARDTAGNTAIYQTPEPIELARPQPTGTLRGVRPVADVPGGAQ